MIDPRELETILDQEPWGEEWSDRLADWLGENGRELVELALVGQGRNKSIETLSKVRSVREGEAIAKAKAAEEEVAVLRRLVEKADAEQAAAVGLADSFLQSNKKAGAEIERHSRLWESLRKSHAYWAPEAWDAKVEHYIRSAIGPAHEPDETPDPPVRDEGLIPW